MKMRSLVEALRGTLPHFVLLLFAFLPVTESKETLYYVCSGVAVAVIIVEILLCVAAKAKPVEILSILLGDTKSNLMYAYIAIVGLLVNYVLNVGGTSFVWWLLLFASVAEIVFPVKWLKK